MTAKAPEHLVEAIRIELKKLVEMPDLDVHLGEIARVAHQADDLLVCLKSPEAVMQGEHAITAMPGVGLALGPNNPETYGATMLRQLVEAFSAKKQANNESPEAITEALAVARREGMTDVAAELEKKLLGKAIDGTPWGGDDKKPVLSSEPPTVDDYLKKADAEREVDKDGVRVSPPVGFGG
jgi:hypothetical protein